MEILTKRPAGMSYKSWEAIKYPVENGESGLLVKKFNPFVGSVKQLKTL
ncbi:hypothetical protein PF672P1_00037 [Parabacteroides phage PF672P1]|nr:hypothetical protein PF672P1_00037 [Parabacteroides phage PF672P1]